MSPKRTGGKTSGRRSARKPAPQDGVNSRDSRIVTDGPVPGFWLTILALVLATCVVYANTLSNRLVFDDLEVVEHNRLLQDPSDIGTIFTSDYRIGESEAALYRPLTIWTLAANHRLNTLIGRPAEDPVSFHLVNLLLHAGVAIALYLCLLSLGVTRWAGAAAALLFVVHPIHTEAVAAVVGRSEMLAALCGLLFLVLHHQRRSPLAAASALLLALWSKESAVAFIAVTVVMDLTMRNRPPRWPWRAFAGYTVTLAIWLVMRAGALTGQALLVRFLDNPLAQTTLGPRVLTSIGVQLDYLRLQFVPIGLSSDYSFNQIPVIDSVMHPRVLIGLLVLATALFTAWQMRAKQPVVTFAILAYCFLSGPTSNLLVPIGTIMGERLAYSPSLMLSLGVAYGAWQLRRRFGRLVDVVFVLVVVVFGGLSIARNRTWADAPTFARAQVESAPGSARAHYGYGGALAEEGNDRAAIVEYRQALAILPSYSEAYFNLGNALRRSGADPAQVIEAYRNTIRFNPNAANAHANLAIFFLENGRIDEARPLIRDLARLDPQYPALAMLRGALSPSDTLTH